MYCLSSFCCVCLNVSPKLQDINQLDEDGLPFINKIIFVSFGHEAIDFKVVRYICPECTNSLRSAYKFKRSCLMNHELLRIYSGQLKYFTGNVSENGDLIVSLEKLPEKSEEDEEPTNKEEEIEENAEPPANDLLRKVSPKDKKKVVVLKCSACDATFNRYVHLQVHYNNRHKSLFKVIKKKINSKEIIVSYICNICSNKLSTLYSLTKHFQLHGTKKATKIAEIPKGPCHYCETTVESNETYKKHLIFNHADRASLSCYLCELTLASDFEFRRHMFVKHTPRKCSHCEHCFFNNSELRAHVAATHRTYKCILCDRAFSQQRNLRSHMKVHEKMMPRAEQETPEPVAENIETTAPEIPEIPEFSETESVSQLPGNVRQFRKKCTNCLSIFSSGVSLQRHKCFKLKNMYQCSICLINYSKKSSFVNHVKKCTLSINTPVPEKITETPKEPEGEPEPEPESQPEQQPIENVIKNENDLEIKEEILDDFICNTTQIKEKNIEIGEVFSITEFPETNSKEIELNESQNNKKTKKIFPKIKLSKKMTKPAENTMKPNETNAEIEVKSEKLKRFSLRHKSTLIDDVQLSDTIFANPEFSDTNDSTPIQVQENVTDPLNNLENLEASSGDDIISNKKRRKSIWMENTEKIAAKKAPVTERRKSVCVDQNKDLNIKKEAILNLQQIDNSDAVNELKIAETVEPSYTKTENVEFTDSNDSTSIQIQENITNLINLIGTVKIGAKKAPIKERRKSFWVESNEDSNPDVLKEIREPVKLRRKSVCVDQNKELHIPNEGVLNPQENEAMNEIKIAENPENPRESITENVDDSTRIEAQEIVTEALGNESVNRKRRKSIWFDDNNELNDTFTSDEHTENVAVKRRRKSIWMENTLNENSNESFVDTEKIGAKKAPAKGRRKSVYVNQNSDAVNAVNPEKNLEPIVLKARRAIKDNKSHRKTICATQETPKNNSNEPSDVNENIANTDGTSDTTKLNSIPIKNADFLSSSSSSIQTFKLRKLRRKSICIDGETLKIIGSLNAEKNENDTNYISVRDVSDINNDISE